MATENARINTRIQQKHDIEANWIKAVNFIPKVGEIIVYDIDDSYNYERMKIGDGETNVNDLPFFANLDTVKELVVTVTQQADGTYIADHYAEELYEHFQTGGTMVATMNNMRHPLLAMYDGLAVFYLEMNNPVDEASYATTFIHITADAVEVDSGILGVMTGATETEDGKFGFVPTPVAGDEGKFLRGDGTWTAPPNEDDALELVAEVGLAEPMTDDEGNILTDENGVLFLL